MGLRALGLRPSFFCQIWIALRRTGSTSLVLTWHRHGVRHRFDQRVVGREVSSVNRILDLCYSRHTAVHHSSSIPIERDTGKPSVDRNLLSCPPSTPSRLTRSLRRSVGTSSDDGALPRHGVNGRLRPWSPSRCVRLFLPFCVAPPSDRPPNTAQFLRETGWSILPKRFRLAGRPVGTASLAILR